VQAGASLRHNRRMHSAADFATPIALVAACLLLGCAAGCQRHAPADRPPVEATAALGSDGQIQWHGMGGCADCDGIDSQLTLRRSAGRSDYTLVETYYIDRRGVRFAEHGRWQQSDSLVRLTGDSGSTRVYALLADGRLQARGTHGAVLPASDAAALVPVSTSDAP